MRNRCINLLKQEQMKNAIAETALLEIKQLGLDYEDSVEKVMIEQ
jgi:hypothetical protein